MCLEKQLGKPEKTEGFGWKFFIQSAPGKPLYSPVFDNEQARPRRTWITANDFARYRCGGHDSEEAGFHIYLNREDAVRMTERQESGYSTLKDKRKVLRKVRYRQAFLQGIGDGFHSGAGPNIVAKEIYIIEANRA